MLVGDILLSAREAVPDLPGVLPPPTAANTAATGIQVVVGSQLASPHPLPVGTYFLQVTYSTPWGESSPSAEFQVALGASQSFFVDASASPYLAAATAVNVYVGTSTGNEIQMYSLPLTAAAPTGIIDSTTPVSLSPPPLGNSAFLLDSGGTVASASQIYRWMNDALSMIAIANGGVPDTCGFGTVIGQANYRMQGDWKNIDAAWYDGYPVSLGSAKQVYRHNSLTSIVGMMSYTQVADQLVCELFPQPVRTAGTTTTAATLSATAASILLNGWGSFVLPYGILQFGTGNACEYVSFTASGNSAISMVRGLGGTDAQAWPNGTPVNEMNLMFAGWRAPSLYVVGNSQKTVHLPTDWIPLIHKYILSRYRVIEQQQEEAMRLEKEFMAGMASATKRKAPIGERQIQPLDTTMVDVYPGLSRTFGGLIIP